MGVYTVHLSGFHDTHNSLWLFPCLVGCSDNRLPAAEACRHQRHPIVIDHRRVILDSRLTLSAHVAARCRSGYCQLRQLRLLVQSMTVEAARTAAAAFISCRLDYCNSLLYGLPDTLLRKLQSVQNATARLITGTRHSDHISPVLGLRELHPRARQVQSGMPGSPVAVRAGASLLGRRLPSRV